MNELVMRVILKLVKDMFEAHYDPNVDFRVEEFFGNEVKQEFMSFTNTILDYLSDSRGDSIVTSEGNPFRQVERADAVIAAMFQAMGEQLAQSQEVSGVSGAVPEWEVIPYKFTDPLEALREQRVSLSELVSKLPSSV